MPNLKQLQAAMAAVEKRIAALQRERDTLLGDVAAIDDEVEGLRGGRGPGRPRKVGRPKSIAGRKARKPKKQGSKRGKPGLTDFLRTRLGKRPVPVKRLAVLARKAGYQSGNLKQVIRLMVGKANDLKRNPDDTIQKKGKPGPKPGKGRRSATPRAFRPRQHDHVVKRRMSKDVAPSDARRTNLPAPVVVG